MSQELTGSTRAAMIALVSLILPGCDHQRQRSAWWEQERERIECVQHLKLAQYRMERCEAGGSGELARLGDTLRGMALRKQALLLTHSTLGAEIQEMKRQIEELAQRTLQSRRMSMVGRKFDTLSIADGRMFQNASITGIDDGGVAIRHQDGSATLRYAELSAEHRTLFGLEENSAGAAQNREFLEALAYECRIDRELEASLKQDAGATALAKTDDEARESPAPPTRESSNPRMNPLARPATPVGSRSGSRGGYGYPRVYFYRTYYKSVYKAHVEPNPFYAPRPYGFVKMAPPIVAPVPYRGVRPAPPAPAYHSIRKIP